MLFSFYVSLQLLKINCIFGSSILIDFAFNFTFLSFSFLSFLKVLSAKNNVLLIYMVTILNIFFLIIINKYRLYINNIMKGFFL